MTTRLLVHHIGLFFVLFLLFFFLSVCNMTPNNFVFKTKNKAVVFPIRFNKTQIMKLLEVIKNPQKASVSLNYY